MSAKFEDYRGKKESLRLEFKGREALDDPRSLPRAVCAMLNAEGGDVLVGVSDDGQLEPIPEPELARHRLHDRLVSTISPSLPSGVEVEVLLDQPVLRISVPKSGARVLHAVRSTEGRLFVPVRTGARTQVLDWPEIVRRIRERAPQGNHAERTASELASELLENWIKDLTLEAPGGSVDTGYLCLVLCATPLQREDKTEAARDLLAEALLAPESLGVRRDGWHYSSITGVGGHRKPFVQQFGKQRKKWLFAGDREAIYRRVEVLVDRECVLRFATRLDGSMRWSQAPLFSKDDLTKNKILHPYALSESVSACCQLFAWLLRRLPIDTADVGGGLALTGIKGFHLPPYHPQTLGFIDPFHWPPPPKQDAVLVWRELATSPFLEKPHRLARLLLTELYGGFGHDVNAVPFWNEQDSQFVYR